MVPIPGDLTCGAFLLTDLAFLAGNVAKVFSGAWVPLLVALFVFSIYWTWMHGYARYQRALAKLAMPVDDFCREIEAWNSRHEGTAILLTRHPDMVPLMKKNAWLRLHARHELILLVTLRDEKIPYVARKDMSSLEKLGDGFYRITGTFGFMQHPDVTFILKCQEGKIPINWNCLVCYLPEATLVSRRGWCAKAILSVYNFLGRNSLSVSAYLGVPAREIVHIGVTLEV